jgi:Tat protein secretion system quality control protein TatD with DNase activity
VHPAHAAEFEDPAPGSIDDADPWKYTVDSPSSWKEAIDPVVATSNASQRLALLHKLCREARDVVVALGEMGLDGAEAEFCPLGVQERYFMMQLKLSRGEDLPLFLHSRSCGMRLAELLEQENSERRLLGFAPVRGVVHSFNGCEEEMQRFLAMDLFLGINGSAFRSEESAATACRIPLDRVLLETDSPWCDIRPVHFGYKFVKTFFPTSKRGRPKAQEECIERRTEPCHLIQVLEALEGSLQYFSGEAVAVADKVLRNTCQCFGFEHQNDDR